MILQVVKFVAAFLEADMAKVGAGYSRAVSTDEAQLFSKDRRRFTGGCLKGLAYVGLFQGFCAWTRSYS